MEKQEKSQTQDQKEFTCPTIIGIRAVKNNGFQYELVDNVKRKSGFSETNVLYEMNSDDDRFRKPGSARHMWSSATIAMMLKQGWIDVELSEKLEALEEGESIETNIENPTVNGFPLKILVIESDETKDPYTLANKLKKAKQLKITEDFLNNQAVLKTNDVLENSAIGDTGYFIRKKTGKFIFTVEKPVATKDEPNHIMYSGDEILFVSEEEAIKLNGLTPIAKKGEVEVEEDAFAEAEA